MIDTQEISDMLALISRLTNEALVNEFTKTLDRGVKGAIYLAMLYKEIWERDLEINFDAWWLDSLIMVAEGSLLPELYYKLKDNEFLLKLVQSLPKKEQRRIVNDDSIAFIDADGEQRALPLTKMSSRLVSQVCTVGRIRTVEEQVAILDDAKQKAAIRAAAKAAKAASKTKITIDKQHRIVTINGSLSFSEFLQYADKISGRGRRQLVESK